MKKKNWIILIAVTAIMVVILAIIGIMTILKINNTTGAEQAMRELLQEEYGYTVGISDLDIEKIDSKKYVATYSTEDEGRLWSRKGTLELEATKSDGEWTANVVEDNIKYTFEKNDNYYHFVIDSNHSEIFQIIDMDKDSVTLRYYSHDLGNWGKDEYDLGTRTEDMTYNTEKGCFEFEYAGDWRVYQYSLEYLELERERGPRDTYEKVEAIDPDDFWWFEEAKKLLEDTEDESVTSE